MSLCRLQDWLSMLLPWEKCDKITSSPQWWLGLIWQWLAHCGVQFALVCDGVWLGSPLCLCFCELMLSHWNLWVFILYTASRFWAIKRWEWCQYWTGALNYKCASILPITDVLDEGSSGSKWQSLWNDVKANCQQLLLSIKGSFPLIDPVIKAWFLLT